MSVTKSFRFLRFAGNRSIRCLYSTESSSGTDAAKDAATPPPQKPKATPSADTDDNTKYLCPEYYEHHELSFYEHEVAMSNKRVGQPSSKSK